MNELGKFLVVAGLVIAVGGALFFALRNKMPQNVCHKRSRLRTATLPLRDLSAAKIPPFAIAEQ